MKFSTTTRACAVAFALTCSTAAIAQESHGDHHDHDTVGHHHDAVQPEPLGASLTEGWLDPWQHADFSRRGTPFVHLFNLEPAFLERDLIVDYGFAKADDEEESELEAELEWAFTRRIGMVFELPLVHLNPDEGDTEQGIGDIAVAPRALLIETDRFLLSANLEVSLPTGSENKGLGSGEVGLAPSFTTWVDLGNWVTLGGQVGTEHGTETGDSELFYAAAITYSFDAHSLFRGHDDAHAGESHRAAGLTSLIGEYTGRTVLSGDDRDRSTAELLFGVSHVLTDHVEVRAAYQFPIGGDEDIDYAVIFGVVYHF